MMKELKTMFEEQAKQELFETVKAFHTCKQEEGQSVSSYLLKMKNYLDTFERLGYAMPNELGKGIPKKVETSVVLAIREGKIQKDKKKKPQGAKGKANGNNKLAYAPKTKTPPPPKEGNGMCTAIESIKSFDLILPSGLIIVLDNCHFAPTATRGVVSISHLVNDGYIHTFTNYGISVLKDNVFYFNAILRDGVYEIDMNNLYPNMARKPFPHQVEMAKDLLGLIHTELCGPFRTVQERVLITSSPLQMISAAMGYVLDTAAHILNMVPTKKVDRTHYKIWHGKAHKLPYLRFWGCEALVKRDMPTKLDSRSIKCIFVGYLKEMMTYYFYYPLENKIFVSQNAKFFENSFMVQEASGSHGLLKMSGSDKGLEIVQEEDTQPSKNSSKEHNKVAPIEKNTDMDSNVHNFKARLVAKGFTQTYGVDYGETFSPVAYIRAIRILLAIVVFYDYKICHFQQNPDEIHWTAVKTILKYLRNTKDMVLVYGAKPRDELKKSDKQSTTTVSFTEAEYIAVTEASMEVVWIRKFIDGLGGVMPSNKRPMEMLCDN
nr:retrotransposon protein, putative, Ty1-copia subclass [Tanacetum cinerariifolium]